MSLLCQCTPTFIGGPTGGLKHTAGRGCMGGRLPTLALHSSPWSSTPTRSGHTGCARRTVGTMIGCEDAMVSSGHCLNIGWRHCSSTGVASRQEAERSARSRRSWNTRTATRTCNTNQVLVTPPPANVTLTKKQIIQQRQEELEATAALSPWFRVGGGPSAVAKDDCVGRLRRRELLIDLLLAWINRRAGDSEDFVEVEVVRYPLHRSDRTKRGVRSEILSTIIPSAKRKTNDVKILRKTVTHGIEDKASGAIVKDPTKRDEPENRQQGDADVVLMIQTENDALAKKTEKRLQTLKTTASTAIAAEPALQSNVSPTRKLRNSMTENEIEGTASVAAHVPGCRDRARPPRARISHSPP